LCQPQVITLTLPTKLAWIFNVVRAGMEEMAGFLEEGEEVVRKKKKTL
jgi:hypothetical protein